MRDRVGQRSHSLLVVVLALGCAAEADRASVPDGNEDTPALGLAPDRLVLEEAATWAAPSDGLIGALILGTNSVVVWDAEARIWAGDENSPLTLMTRTGVVVLEEGANRTAHPFEVIDPQKGSLFRVDALTGKPLGEVDCPALLGVKAATRLGDEILFLLMDEPSGAVSVAGVESRPGKDCGSETHVVAFPGPGPELTSGATLSTDGSAVFLNPFSPDEAPWKIQETGDGLVATWKEDLVPSPTLPSGFSRVSRWASLPLIPLDRGWLRVFSDLTSDTRVFQIWVGDKMVPRQKILSEPIAFVASSQRLGLLVGMRLLPTPEVVFFGGVGRMGKHRAVGLAVGVFGGLAIALPVFSFFHQEPAGSVQIRGLWPGCPYPISIWYGNQHLGTIGDSQEEKTAVFWFRELEADTRLEARVFGRSTDLTFALHNGEARVLILALPGQWMIERGPFDGAIVSTAALFSEFGLALLGVGFPVWAKYPVQVMVFGDGLSGHGKDIHFAMVQEAVDSVNAMVGTPVFSMSGWAPEGRMELPSSWSGVTVETGTVDGGALGLTNSVDRCWAELEPQFPCVREAAVVRVEQVAQTDILIHELLHTLGLRHSCLVQSAMNTAFNTEDLNRCSTARARLGWNEGLELRRDFSAWDVAAIQILIRFAVRIDPVVGWTPVYLLAPTS